MACVLKGGNEKWCRQRSPVHSKRGARQRGEGCLRVRGKFPDLGGGLERVKGKSQLWVTCLRAPWSLCGGPGPATYSLGSLGQNSTLLPPQCILWGMNGKHSPAREARGSACPAGGGGRDLTSTTDKSASAPAAPDHGPEPWPGDAVGGGVLLRTEGSHKGWHGEGLPRGPGTLTHHSNLHNSLSSVVTTRGTH